MTAMTRGTGKVRAARLTDLAALGELSRLAQSDGDATRSLGLPVSAHPIGMFSLFRLPLGAFRPHDVLYVYESDRRIAGLLRVERETPVPVQRLEAIRLTDWERQGLEWRVPRSSLAPILRFADVEAYAQQHPDGGADGTQLQAFVQVGVAKEDQPHYLKVMAAPGIDLAPIVTFGLGVIAARTDRGADRRGILAPVRTYESPIDNELEARGFEQLASVTLLMKETLIRVAEPALVPAGVR